MAKGINILTPQSVRGARCEGAKRAKFRDGQGLYLIVTAAQSKSWSFFYSFSESRREMTLGSSADVTLAQAREAAKDCRAKLRDGVDPLAEREARKAADQIVEGISFGAVADDLLNSLEDGWKHPKHRQQWRNSLKTYCKPIWDIPVAAVDTPRILEILSPIWIAKGATATKLRGRIERVLAAAKVLGHRSGENPARWKEHLQVLLPKAKRSRKHHPAMPYDQISFFIRALRRIRGNAARALEFTILTGARTNETIGAVWKEIDLKRKMWIVPPERMKENREHRVALSDAAIAVLTSMAYTNDGPDSFVFPGLKRGTGLSNMAMESVLRRMDYDQYTVHGFRSSFRDWVGEETEYPRDLAEMALSHAVGDEVEQAYRRGDGLKRRFAMMNDWATHCFEPEMREAA